MIVAAPVAGTVVGLDAVPDEVFAAGMVGPGVAVEPSGPGTVEVVAPVAGTLVKVHPHAFAMTTGDATGVLVHLGIDTVRLRGEGFEVVRTEGESVQVGDVIVRWSPDDVRARGMSAVCPAVVLDVDPDRVSVAATIGVPVAAGAPLLHVLRE
ncbi:PTS sugar transporter subunit IIA [Actinomycetospora termitidis]|uniref:PTS glucose transporter subunit IIA n=1 Tax=Actinomycetospora termitidis TaxID=3053470 RepID=A0ABT7MBV0_9PSEU|nr:PTS glucose transporter subunit IIA [Actinomycetospora sp. Odt1-22]MDL5158118.1 PTS glucose transporter subunit IIA [Actinomycetospora sp. Odt1-22]